MANSVFYATGGSGPFNTQIAWLNFTGVSLTTTVPVAFTNSIPNVGIINLTLTNQLDGTLWQGFFPNGLSLYSTTAYTGLDTVRMSMRLQGTATSTVNFNNISITDLSGKPLIYDLFVSDTEQTNQGEFIRWVTDGSPWNQLVTIPNSVGNTITGNGTETLQTSGNASGSYSIPVAASKAPKNLIIGAKSLGAQMSAVGILINSITTSKSVSSTTAGIGTVLTYTIPVTNTSLDTLSSINFVDTLPNSITFLPGSFSENGVSKPDPTFPNATLSDIASGATSTIVFKVTVTSTVPNPIINSAFISGFQGTYPNSGVTNSVTTTINFAQVNTTKYVDKSTAQAGDTLTYTIVLTNTGSTTAASLTLIDTIPSTTTYVTGSVTGATGTPPNFIVGNIGPSKTTTVSFNVLLGTLPDNPILNNSTSNYFYFLNGGTTGATIPGATVSNEVSTNTASATISSMTKTASESYGILDDTITYTISFTNTGNDTALNITFLDTIPNNTSFNNDTLYVNNVQQIGQSPAPPGISISNLGSGQTTTVTFTVNVTTLPTVNPIINQGVLSYGFAANTTPNAVISNIVATTINYSSLTSTKIVSNAYANIGQVLTYIIPITNTGNTTASSIVFLDTIPNGTSLVAGSFNQDGTPISGSSNTPGVTLPNSIGANRTSTITFQVRITTVPNPNPIPNNAAITSTFTIDNTTTPNRTGSAITNTNTVNTLVNFASLSGITKSVDKTYATCGDIITYTIVTPNSGSVTALNVVVRDTIPNGTVLLQASVTVNGIQQTGANPATGVTIPNIGPGSTATLTFQVQVQC